MPPSSSLYCERLFTQKHTQPKSNNQSEERSRDLPMLDRKIITGTVFIAFDRNAIRT